MKTLITVYIPTYNYADYINKSVDSVISQTMDDWELIIIDDGSTDNTKDKIEQYFENKKITIVEQENHGLNVTNNIALRLARGKYIMRLDADDYLDENALQILSNILDKKTDVSLVYPDYFEISPDGEVIRLVRREKIGQEVELLDLPAHGACTLFRTNVLKQLGGYMEEFSCQDGYEIWLRFIEKYKPYNINIPLFYYRQHPVSLTKNNKKILETRKKIKKVIARRKSQQLKVLGIIPVSGESIYHFGEPFQRINGHSLISYTIKAAQESELLDKVVLATDEEDVVEYAKKYEFLTAIKRPASLSKTTTEMHEIVNYVLDKFEERNDYSPDAVCTLYINTPLRNGSHIDKAINTMSIFDTDSVISITEQLSFCYQHGMYGLVPIEKSRKIRTERNAVFVENGAIILSKVNTVRQEQMLGTKISHITMLPEESIQIKNSFDLWLVNKITSEWNNSQ